MRMQTTILPQKLDMMASGRCRYPGLALGSSAAGCQAL